MGSSKGSTKGSNPTLKADTVPVDAVLATNGVGQLCMHVGARAIC